MVYEVRFLDADREAWSTEALDEELGRVIGEKIRRGCVITAVTPLPSV